MPEQASSSGSRESDPISISSESQAFERGIELAVPIAGQMVADYAFEVDERGQFPMGGKQWRLKENAPLTAQHAGSFLASLGLYVERSDQGDVSGALSAMYAVGWFSHEIISASSTRKPSYEALEAYSNLQAGGRNGSHIVNADHVELHAEYQAAIDSLMEHGESSGLSYGKAILEAAKKFGVSKSTVENHTTNKWPRRGGRPRKPT